VDNVLTEAGKDFVNKLLCRLSKARLVNRPILAGMDPPSLFPSKLSTSKDVIAPMVAGNVPVIDFLIQNTSVISGTGSHITPLQVQGFVFGTCPVQAHCVSTVFTEVEATMSHRAEYPAGTLVGAGVGYDDGAVESSDTETRRRQRKAARRSTKQREKENARGIRD